MPISGVVSARRLGIETVSRRTNVSFWSCIENIAHATSRSCLDLGPKGLGVSSRVSDHFMSSRRFVQFSNTKHYMP